MTRQEAEIKALKSILEYVDLIIESQETCADGLWDELSRTEQKMVIHEVEGWKGKLEYRLWQLEFYGKSEKRSK